MSLLWFFYGALVVALVLGGAVCGWIARPIVTGWFAEKRATRLARHGDAAIAVGARRREDPEMPHLRIAWRLPAIADSDRNTRPPLAT